ncbi:MAG: valine--tRNA ligase [Candidatus Daviesbacteria bacterium]|nr:MAG: valine--tRNA ligase [Candidatus Daviesbacteria bacterium]
MDKTYNQKIVEEKWYKFWEEKGFFKPEINPDGQPYTIILPPPNANAPLHFGHAMYVVEDILIRYHRMLGEATLWLPGSDHAGFETQVVFEKKLEKMGKSRFDYDRDTLYQMIWDFVQDNKGAMEGQLRRLGFSLDWSRMKFTLDPEIVKIVYKTFKKLFDDGLLYRAERLVNYCTTNGTSFSDLEVIYEERNDKFYYLKYPLADSKDYIIIATTRPETMLGDTAVAVNPEDKRYKHLISKKVRLPLTDREIPIIADDAIDTELGTGAEKVTPAHDPADFELGQKHHLDQISVINFDGTMAQNTGKYAGTTLKEARQAILEDLEAQGLVEKIADYSHRVAVCYKCGTPIQPLLKEQWFINIQDLAQKAVEVVKIGDIKIYPQNWETTYFHWLENIKDWNISRQIVWGIQIPAWHCQDCHEWTVTDGITPPRCDKCSSLNLEKDSDVFDTWFSSGQWPFATLQSTKEGDFEKFYPTSVIETMYDILLFWVARMVMLGIYTTNQVPFKNIVLHGKVLDPLGQKMSKSKGNVVNPMEIVDQYGADAARMALVYGTAFGHDQALSHPKLQAMRNFTNKLWNIGRFILMYYQNPEARASLVDKHITAVQSLSNSNDKVILEKLNQTSEAVTKALDAYRFHDAAEVLYEFIWHQFADKYIESAKDRRAEAQPILEYVFRTSLELLHPFMPFITEELWQKLPHKGDSIMINEWPRA